MSPADNIGFSVCQLILELAEGEHLLLPIDFRSIQAHVAGTWYNLSQEQRIPRELVGVLWERRVLQAGDKLPTDVVHYLKHVVTRREWPSGMTFPAYCDSLRKVIRDESCGLMTSLYGDKGYHLSIVRRSGELQGPGGHEWLLIEYRLSTGNIATAFQLEEGLDYFDRPGRREKRWLRRPRQMSGLTLD